MQEVEYKRPATPAAPTANRGGGAGVSANVCGRWSLRPRCSGGSGRWVKFYCPLEKMSWVWVPSIFYLHEVTASPAPSLAAFHPSFPSPPPPPPPLRPTPPPRRPNLWEFQYTRPVPLILGS